MPTVVVVENDRALCKTYVGALVGAGHTVKYFNSDTEAIDYLVRQRKSPDAVLVDMRWPGSLEIVVLSAVSRLSHLAHTRILVIGHLPQRSQRSVQFVRADMLWHAPVSPDLLTHTIHMLTAGLDPKILMEEDTPTHTTRVWWEGVEAIFVRWTDQALVFAWEDTTETAVKIPRGAVIRLLHKGVLNIEGDAPAWAGLSPVILPLSPDTTSTAVHSEQTPSSSVQTALAGYNSEDDDWHSPKDPTHTNRSKSGNRSEKVTAIARLIRKLTGGGSPRRQGKPLDSTSGS